MDVEYIDIAGQMLQMIGWVFLPFALLPIFVLGLAQSKFLETFQFTIIEIIDTVNLTIGEWVKWLLVLMVVSIAFATIALSIFGQSWTKLDESSIYFHALIILLGSAATLLAGKHVRVDIFYTKMGPKAKALVDLLGFYALLIPFCLVIIWNAQGTVHLAWLSLEGSAESDGIRGVFLLKTCISVFALLLLLQGMAIAGRAALLLTNKASPVLPDYIDPFFGLKSDAKPVEPKQ
ncbi:MAG: permease [Robiginitomaculum sp.]|nr:MAG: permease [Robiginitomaculum sp.]